MAALSGEESLAEFLATHEIKQSPRKGKAAAEEEEAPSEGGAAGADGGAGGEGQEGEEAVNQTSSLENDDGSHLQQLNMERSTSAPATVGEGVGSGRAGGSDPGDPRNLRLSRNWSTMTRPSRFDDDDDGDSPEVWEQRYQVVLRRQRQECPRILR